MHEAGSTGSQAQRSRWLTATLAAVVLHLAIAAPCLLSMSSEVKPAPADAPLAIEVATLEAAPPIPPHQRPIDVTPQHAVSRPPPPAAHTPPVTTKEPVNKAVAPVVQVPPPPPSEERPPISTESAAATVSPPTEAKQAAAPVLGHADSPVMTAQQSWESEVLTKLDRFKRYPQSARWQGQEDTVYLRLTIARDGTVRSASVGQSQGFTALDEEAIEMVGRASPLPAPPPSVEGSSVMLTIPVEFYIGRH